MDIFNNLLLTNPSTANSFTPLNSSGATHYYIKRTGSDWISGGSATGIVLLAVSPRKLPSGRVVNVRLHTSGSGTFKICLIRPDGAGNATIVERSADITTGAPGTITLVAGVDFPAWILDGQLQVAIQTGTSGAPGLRFSSSVGEGYQIFSGTASGTFALSETTGGCLFYTVDVAVEESRVGGATLEMADFGSLPSGWSNGSTTWTFDPIARAATSGTVGLANQIRSGLRFGVDKRTIKWKFRLGDSSSVAAFVTNPQEGGIQAGSMVRVSAADQELQIFTAYTGSNTPTEITSVAAAVSASTDYIFTWTKSGRSFTATVSTPSGTVIATITRTATPWGYSTYPSYGYDQGTMQGCSGVAAIAGSVILYEYEQRAACMVKPNLYVLGDSITEGFSVTDSQKYATLLANVIGDVRVVSSGIGGAVTSGALNRIASEVTCIRPKNVLIYLGTNPDASFAANIVKIAYACQALGANVYIATVATSSTHTTTVNALASWVKKIAFDVALTASGAGSALTAALYNNTDGSGASYNDSLHPNSLGHTAMFNRVITDAPELFFV